MTMEEQLAAARWRLQSLASSASTKLDGLEYGMKALRDELKASKPCPSRRFASLDDELCLGVS